LAIIGVVAHLHNLALICTDTATEEDSEVEKYFLLVRFKLHRIQIIMKLCCWVFH